MASNDTRITLALTDPRGRQVKASEMDSLTVKVWTQSQGYAQTFTAADIADEDGEQVLRVPHAAMEHMPAGVIEYSYTYDVPGTGLYGRAAVTPLVWPGCPSSPGEGSGGGVIYNIARELNELAKRVAEGREEDAKALADKAREIYERIAQAEKAAQSAKDTADGLLGRIERTDERLGGKADAGSAVETVKINGVTALVIKELAGILSLEAGEGIVLAADKGKVTIGLEAEAIRSLEDRLAVLESLLQVKDGASEMLSHVILGYPAD